MTIPNEFISISFKSMTHLYYNYIFYPSLEMKMWENSHEKLSHQLSSLENTQIGPSRIFFIHAFYECKQIF